MKIDESREMLTTAFGPKKLRKANSKCEITGLDITNPIVYSIYNLQQILDYIKDDEITLYWIFDRMWEDWLIVTNRIVPELEYSFLDWWNKSGVALPLDLDDHAKQIIDKVVDNLKTPLGTRTSYINEYDPSLLVPIKRAPTRESIGYEYIPFRGLDVWNGYELSYLDRTGKPVNKMIRIAYDSDSESIIESKSLKLYFNSFNNTKTSLFTENDRGTIIDVIKEDIKNSVKANIIEACYTPYQPTRLTRDHYLIDNLYIDQYKYDYDPEFLSIRPSLNNKPIYLKSELLKSNCRHSGLPDWGTAYISYLPNIAEIDEISLLQYIVSFRNHREFHEECCERIMHDILFKINPQWLRVELRYTRRGGIDINPIRVYDSQGIYDYDFYSELSFYCKEDRQ